MAQCPLCGKPATKACGKCHAVGYCSTKCDNSDQGLHFLLCKDYISFNQNFLRPPSTIHSTHVLGLLFPDDSNSPQLVWVKLWIASEKEKGQFETTHLPKLNQYFGNFDPVTSQVFEFGAGCLDHSLEIWRQEKNPATCQNQCVEYLLTGCDASEWRKSVLVFSKFPDPHQNDKSLPLYQDVTLSDLRLALKFIASEVEIMDATAFNPFLALDDFEWYHGVEICCQKDQDLLGYQQYRQVKVKKSHRVFKKGAIPDVSKHLEFPLLVMNRLSSARWAGKSSPSNKTNNIKDEAHSMMISAYYDSKSWAEVDNKWTPNPEITVLVVRRDGTVLTPRQVEVFVNFCVQAKEVMGGTGDTQARKDLVKSQMNRDRFQAYFAEFKLLKLGDGDGSWAEVVSPYGI